MTSRSTITLSTSLVSADAPSPLAASVPVLENIQPNFPKNVTRKLVKKLVKAWVPIFFSLILHGDLFLRYLFSEFVKVLITKLGYWLGLGLKPDPKQFSDTAQNFGFVKYAFN